MVAGACACIMMVESAAAADVVTPPPPVLTPIEQRWLDAEAKPTFDAWHGLYNEMVAGAALPEGVSPDTLVLNMVYAALNRKDYALAEESTEALQDKATAIFARLYVLRMQGVAEKSAHVQRALLALQPKAQQVLSGTRLSDWSAALATALLDSSSTREPPAEVFALLNEQTVPRHRSYLLHRIALLHAALPEKSAEFLPLNSAAVDMAIKEGKLEEAYRLLATAAMSKKNTERNAALQRLHDAATDGKHAALALHALWLIDRDMPQNKALMVYMEALATKGNMEQARAIADMQSAGADRAQAYRRLRNLFKKLEKKEERKIYDALYQAELAAIETEALKPESAPAFQPFRRWKQGSILFDAPARMKALSPATANLCSAQKAGDAGEPIAGFKTAGEYGTDRRAQAFSWHVMVLTAHTLAGDKTAATTLKNTLLTWARARAFENSEGTFNALFPLKRLLLPTIIATSVLEPTLSTPERKELRTWLSTLLKRTNMIFHGEVDVNNHRYLTDASQMAWGVLTGDAKRYHQGIARLYAALEHMRPDGSLPLETRRGSRSTWYMRQSLASLTAIAQMASMQGQDVFSAQVEGRNLSLMLSYFMNAAQNPMVIFPFATENLTPGYGYNVFEQERGMLTTRGRTRHYMAFIEPWLVRYKDGFFAARLQQFVKTQVTGKRPFTDEFSGGNASCYYGRISE
jgi:poly(beta-D-mannuronate) lyase